MGNVCGFGLVNGRLFLVTSALGLALAACGPTSSTKGPTSSGTSSGGKLAGDDMGSSTTGSSSGTGATSTSGTSSSSSGTTGSGSMGDGGSGSSSSSTSSGSTGASSSGSGSSGSSSGSTGGGACPLGCGAGTCGADGLCSCPAGQYACSTGCCDLNAQDTGVPCLGGDLAANRKDRWSALGFRYLGEIQGPGSDDQYELEILDVDGSSARPRSVGPFYVPFGASSGDVLTAAIALDAQDQSHVVTSNFDSNSSPGYAWIYIYPDGGLEPFTCGGELGIGPTGAVDLVVDRASGVLQMAWAAESTSYSSDEGDIVYSRRDPDAGWSCEIVDQGIHENFDGVNLSLVLDDAGTPAIAYRYNHGNTLDGANVEIRLAQREDGGWSHASLTSFDGGTGTADDGLMLAATNVAGRVLVSYGVSSDPSGVEATWADPLATERIAEIPDAGYSSILHLWGATTDAQGAPHVLFDDPYYGLTDATRTDAGWHLDIITGEMGGTDEVTDPTGVIHTLYCGYDSLMHVTR